jgi:hypothetical protein
MPAWLTEIMPYLDFATKVIVICGFPLAYLQYHKAKKKEKQDREYGTYNSLDEKYIEFQKMCLQRPYLDIYDIADATPKKLTEEQKKEELILFTMLFSIFERAYLLYSDQKSEIKKKQWSGWDIYIKSYCTRENFLQAWETTGATFDTDFEEYMKHNIKDSSKATPHPLPQPQ